MDTVQRQIAGLTLLVAAFVCVPVAHAASMPAIQPIAVQPIGAAPGSGIATQVTYQIGGSAVNDAGVAAAANEASYVSRAVTMSGGTVGGIMRGGLTGASKFLGWVGLAITAYQIYKWYKDSQTGNLLQPGQTIPGVSCGGGQYFATVNQFGANGCSVVGLEAKWKQIMGTAQDTWVSGDLCVPSGVGSQCSFTVTYHHAGFSTNTTGTEIVKWYGSGAPTMTDPTVTTDPTPVSDQQLADLANQHPEWWPQLFTDPQTGNVVINPDIAHDMDALKQQLAPTYGVDPTTLTPTPSDPNYGTQQSTPKQTDLPQYCAWAAAACDYYKFVEDNWPDSDNKHQYTDSNCDAPPSCSGDQVLCGVAQNTWVAKCSFGSDGTQPPEGGKHVVGDIDSGQTVDTGDTSKLDTSGLGWGTSCPFTDFSIEVGGVSKTISFQPVCDYGPWMRGFVLLLAALGCAGILGGFKIGSIFGGS